jgi:hypothetical protein
MNAIATSIEDSRVIMPPPVQRLIQQIPDWLSPFVRVIDGDIFRERIIEREQKASTWEDVQIRDEPILGCEPGVIIGPYVLVGWGPREVAAELKRREQVQLQTDLAQAIQTAGLRAARVTAGAVLMALASFVLLVWTLKGASAGFLTFLTSIAAIGSTWLAAYDHATARRQSTPLISAHFLTGSLSCQFLLAMYLLARWYMPLTWVIPIALAGAAMLCHAIGRRFQA